MAVYSPRQLLVVHACLAISSKVGPWGRGHDVDGAAYLDEAANTAKDQGFVCHNCAFWKPPSGCAIVKGAINPKGICRLHVIPQERVTVPKPPSRAPARRVRGRIDGETL